MRLPLIKADYMDNPASEALSQPLKTVAVAIGCVCKYGSRHSFQEFFSLLLLSFIIQNGNFCLVIPEPVSCLSSGLKYCFPGMPPAKSMFCSLSGSS